MNIGSLLGDFLTFRPGVAGHMPEEPTETSTEQKDHAGEGRADYLERQKPGTRIDVCVCRLCKSAEHSKYLKYHQRKS